MLQFLLPKEFKGLYLFLSQMIHQVVVLLLCSLVSFIAFLHVVSLTSLPNHLPLQVKCLSLMFKFSFTYFDKAYFDTTHYKEQRKQQSIFQFGTDPEDSDWLI